MSESDETKASGLASRLVCDDSPLIDLSELFICLHQNSAQSLSAGAERKAKTQEAPRLKQLATVATDSIMQLPDARLVYL
jgi:hypothetical protein